MSSSLDQIRTKLINTNQYSLIITESVPHKLREIYEICKKYDLNYKEISAKPIQYKYKWYSPSRCGDFECNCDIRDIQETKSGIEKTLLVYKKQLRAQSLKQVLASFLPHDINSHIRSFIYPLPQKTDNRIYFNYYL